MNALRVCGTCQYWRLQGGHMSKLGTCDVRPGWEQLKIFSSNALRCDVNRGAAWTAVPVVDPQAQALVE